MGINRGVFVRATGTAPSKVGTTPNEARLALAGQFMESSPGVPRSGVLATSQGAAAVVAANSGSMVYDIMPVPVVVNRAAGEGVYVLTTSGTTQVATDPAPGSNSRWDIIYVKQDDPDKGDADNNGVVGVAKGTAAASPTKPAIPTGAYALAEARIYSGTTTTAGGTNTITQLYKWTVARGGVCPVLDVTDRATITPYLGQRISRLDRENWIQVWNGTSWDFEGWRRNEDVIQEFLSASTASKQLLLIDSTKPYARRCNAYGRATVSCPAISTGTEDINIAISVGQSQVVNSQGRARITWTAGLSNCNQSQSVSTRGPITVAAATDVVVRLWIEVVTGTLSLTPAPSNYHDLWFDYQPVPD